MRCRHSGIKGESKIIGRGGNYNMELVKNSSQDGDQVNWEQVKTTSTFSLIANRKIKFTRTVWMLDEKSNKCILEAKNGAKRIKASPFL